MKTRVALLHNIIAPYRFPLFEALSQQKAVDLHVYFLSKTAKNRKWNWKKYVKQMKFAYSVLPHWTIPLPLPEKIPVIVNPTYIWELIKGKYDVVITAGWFDLSCLVTYVLAPIFRYKYIIWSESTNNEPSLQRTLSLPVVKWAVRNAASCIAIGTVSKEYLVSLGAKAERVAVALSTVDIEHFSKGSQISTRRKKALRQELGFSPDSKVIMYAGQFIPRKNVKTLLLAYSMMKTQKKALLLVGYGELEQELKDFVRVNKLPEVAFVAHTEVDLMPHYYAVADVFVLPSLEETWGLVVNEAMACGLPVLLSNKVGSRGDLLEEGKNGWSFSPLNHEQLSKQLEKLCTDEKQRLKFGERSRAIIQKASPENAAAGFFLAIQSAIPPASLKDN